MRGGHGPAGTPLFTTAPHWVGAQGCVKGLVNGSTVVDLSVSHGDRGNHGALRSGWGDGEIAAVITCTSSSEKKIKKEKKRKTY
jgi:hypothetical protein